MPLAGTVASAAPVTNNNNTLQTAKS